MSVEIMRRFGPYFLLDLVGEGGMGEIYRAIPVANRGSSHPVILKCMRPLHATRTDSEKMFRAEIRVLAMMKHVNIVEIFDIGENESIPYYTMEYVAGRSLQELLRRVRSKAERLPISVIVDLVLQAARALKFIHNFQDPLSGQDLHVIHRDVSPANLLITRDGIVKLIDFGIVKSDVNETETAVGQIKGNPHYLSPEQIRNDDLDFRTDLYSLGVVFWEMLAGRRLFHSKTTENYSVLFQEITNSNNEVIRPSTINSNVPLELDEIVLRSISRNVEDRFLNAEHFLTVLSQFVEQTPRMQPEDTVSKIMHDYFAEDFEIDAQKSQELVRKATKSSAVLANQNLDFTEPTKKIFRELGLKPLQIGEQAPDFHAMSHDGDNILLNRYAGKPVWLCIYRYATCPMCCLHLFSVIQRISDLERAGIQVIAVFESEPNLFLRPETGKTPLLIQSAPFPLVADPEKRIYSKYRLRTNILGVYRPRVLWNFIKAWLRGFRQGRVDGEMAQLPAHFLIDQNQKIKYVRYAKSIIDHPSVDEILAVR